MSTHTSAAAVRGAADSAAWVHRDGRVLPVGATAVPITDRAGNQLATIRLLRAVATGGSQPVVQSAAFEAALDLMPISVLTLGEDGRIAHANAAVCRLLGHATGALTATAVGDLIAGSLRGADPHPGRCPADLVIETTLRCQDGTALAVEMRIAAQHSGKGELLLVSVSDVSARAAAEQARRTSEQKLRALVDSSAQMVWTTDANGAATEDSPSWRAYTGQTCEQQRGLGYLDAVHPEDRGRVEALWRNALAKREIVTFEYRVRMPEGGWRWLSTRAAPVFDAERRVTSWVGMNMDISERKREQALAHGQTEVLEMIARGRALHETLDRLLQVVEGYSDLMLTSILLLDVDGAHLRHGAAPRLPAEYNRAIDGIAIGPSVGSCGTAAFTGEPVYAEDIQTDPRWKDFKELAGGYGLRACWSTPIKDSEDRVLGTFAIYYRNPGLPTGRDLRLIELATQTAAISIERHRNEVESKASERRYRELEQALHEGESNNRALLEALADGVFVAQGERFVFVNPALPAMLGYAVEQFVGRAFADVVAPEYLPVWRERYAKRISKGPEPLRHYEVQFLRVDGSRIWVELRASRVTYKGAPGVLGIIRDVSEAHEMHERLRKSESQLLSLVEQAPVGLAMLDRDLRYIAVSRRWLREFSRGRTDIVGHSHLEIQPDVPERWKEWYRRALAGEVLGSDEDRWQQADGSEHWLSWAVLPWRDAQGAIGGIIISAEDISARKRSDALQVRSQKLEALGTLAGGIAHDFNNILTAITGNVSLAMIDLPPGHAVQESLREIRGAANRAVELVRRILAFSRPQEIHRHPAALQPVVEEAVHLLRSTLPAMIRIGLRAEGELPMVAIDASHVHQIVLNLVTNAAHAIGNRVGSIDIVLVAVEVSAEHAAALPGMQAGAYVRLTVSDDGCGMDKATVERIFDPFFTTKPVGEGTGLGLSVVHGIVHSHGGAISVYSEPGRGTAMHVYFPVVSAAQGSAAAPPASGEVPSGNGEHILYVDDEAALVSLTVRMLERLGYRVTGCNDPQRALELFQQNPQGFDVLVTDAAMSGMSGFDLARAVHRLRPGLPIVMASGYLRAEDQEAALRIGIRELIVKPGVDGDLGRALGRVLAPARESATLSGG